MQRYFTFGKLLTDYRILHDLSQLEFANKINVDIRTIQRWEKNQTLVKSEKEEDIIEKTLFPCQLVRNLNSSVPIPTFYNMRVGKYSLTEINTEMPDASWFKSQIDIKTDRIRPFNFDKDFEYIAKYMDSYKNMPRNMVLLISEAAKRIPELNVIITDDLGFYSGHSIIFPITFEAYQNLKTKKIREDQLTIKDLGNYKSQEPVIFFGFDITADCNDNSFYLFNHLFRFVRDLPNQNYIYCSIASRYDSLELSEDFGLNIIWKEDEEYNKLHMPFSRRFQEGNFIDFLA